MRFKSFSILLLFLIPHALSSQTGELNLHSPFISYLEAEVNASAVVLTWRDPADTENIIFEIRRYDREITVENLDSTELLAHVAPGIRTFTDNPDEHTSWWYAVISIRNDKAIKLIVPWRNTLGSPVTITPGEIQIDKSPVIPAALPQKMPLSDEAAAALLKILNPEQGKLWVAAESEILNADYSDSSDKYQAVLDGILDGSFAREDWPAAEAELLELSAVENLPKELKARILFYKGECLYFQHKLQEAFLSFLLSSDYYYTESRRWMIRIYRELTPVS